MRVRPIDPAASDEVALVALRMRLTLVEVLGEEVGGSMYDAAWLQDRVMQHLDGRIERAEVFVAEIGESIVGHTIVRVDADDDGSPIGLFSTIYVDPSARARGVAGELIAHGEAWMRKRRMRVARTYTATTNEPLHRLFGRHGYTIIDTRGEFAVISKSLEPQCRTATDGDAGRLADLGAQTFFEAYIAQTAKEELDDYNLGHFTVEILARQLKDPDSTFLIAEFDGSPIGYAHLRRGSTDVAVHAERPIEIVRFYLLDSAKGKGFGTTLMEECLAKAADADAIWLAVWDENPGAIAFYRRFGFEVVGRTVFEFAGRPDVSLVMSLALQRRTPEPRGDRALN